MFQKLIIPVVAALVWTAQPGQAQVRGGGHMSAPAVPRQEAATLRPFAPPASPPIRYYGNYGPANVPYGSYHSNLGYRIPDYATPNTQHNYYGTFPYYDNYYFFYNQPDLSPNTIQDPVFPGSAADYGTGRQPAGAQPPAVEPPAVATPPADGAVHFTVRLPANAQVWFNGTQMPGTGAVREFRTPPLTPGRYKYDIRVQWQENGRDVAQDRQVTFFPGDNVEVDFPAR
jgi:uncharacterized protein (TIGR03000 family)